MRRPSLRDPRGFYDLLVVDLFLVGLIALELAITRAYLVRVEVVAVSIAVFLWNVWAVIHILGRAGGRSQ